MLPQPLPRILSKELIYNILVWDREAVLKADGKNALF